MRRNYRHNASSMVGMGACRITEYFDRSRDSDSDNLEGFASAQWTLMTDFNSFMKRLDCVETEPKRSVSGESLKAYRDNYDAVFAEYVPTDSLTFPKP